MGRSTRDMLTALLAGEVDPAVLAELALGRMRSKRDLLLQALQGHIKPHHCFLLSEQLADIDTLDEATQRMSTEIAERFGPYEHQIQRLSTIPGIKRLLAEVILAEIGPDMSRFPDARHLASCLPYLLALRWPPEPVEKILSRYFDRFDTSTVA